MYAVAAFILCGALALMAPTSETKDGIQGVENIVDTNQSTELLVKEIGQQEMEVHFIDVGQGDATLIKLDGHYMLIDAGGNDKGTLVQLYLQKQGVEKLDYLILTHTDADHIGGADVIVTKFDVETVLLGDFPKENETYEELLNALQYKRLKSITPEAGSEYQLGNASFLIVAPNRTYEDPNNSSIGLLLKNGENTFLFTGDCEKEAEEDILANGLNIDCDVYKLGHHGSSTSSSKTFLEAITPIYGVISCAEGNSYGHPHAEPLNNLRSMGVQIFRTDEQGSIIAYSDGTEITWNCAPSDTWQTGEIVENALNSETAPQTAVAVTDGEAAEESAAAVTDSETAEESERKENGAITESSSTMENERKESAESKVREEATVAENDAKEESPTVQVQQNDYVIGNKNSKVFHRPSCSRLPKEKNRVIFNNRDEALATGYDNPCDYCNP